MSSSRITVAPKSSPQFVVSYGRFPAKREPIMAHFQASMDKLGGSFSKQLEQQVLPSVNIRLGME